VNKPAKQSAEPKQFTEAQLRKTKKWLENPKRIAKEVEEEAKQKPVRRRAIRTLRQKLQREAKAKRCTDARKWEIEQELSDLRGLDEQLCGTGKLKHPSSRPSARELGFKTETPSADEILEAATIQQLLRSKKPASNKVSLMLAKLAKKDPATWGEVAKAEALHNPRIERTRERIDYGDIAEIKYTEVDRVIAENYFKSLRLTKPLRELSADKASIELRKLDVAISPQAFERALRRLDLVD